MNLITLKNIKNLWFFYDLIKNCFFKSYLIPTDLLIKWKLMIMVLKVRKYTKIKLEVQNWMTEHIVRDNSN